MSQENKQKNYGMAIDLRKCVGCMSCSVSCKMENGVPFGVFRSWVNMTEKGDFPTVKRYYQPRLCNHCENAPCVEVCPVKASYKREDGLVLIDKKKCIGCGYCVASCPYNARYMSKAQKVADKCTFCDHRVDNGGEPTCVKNCMGKARIFGDLNDPNSMISQLVSRNAVQVIKPEKGTKPQVFYIAADFNHQPK